MKAKSFLLALLAMTISLSAFGEEAEVNGLWYDFVSSTKQAQVIKYKSAKYSGDLSIPATVKYGGVTYSVTSIGASAFYDCGGLYSVTIGRGIERIGELAFAKCPKLSNVYCYAKTVPNADANVFEDSDISYCRLSVPASALESYNATAPWSGFGTKVALNLEKCATPTVEYADGELFFDCETEDVDFDYEITVADANKGHGSGVKLSTTYRVTVCAFRDGYEDSDPVTYEINVRGLKGDVNGDGSVTPSDAIEVLYIFFGVYNKPTTDAVAVDLGLPSGTKWADRNVGAKSPEDYGGYFAWGETEEKEVYNWSTYTHCDGSSETCHDIGSDIAGTQYDVANVKWGGAWKMPTYKQVNELVNNCTSEWTTENGVNGRKFTGPNGKSIFLPAAGSRRDSALDNAGSYATYWLSEGWSEYADDLRFYSDEVIWGLPSDRDYGYSVRPVR